MSGKINYLGLMPAIHAKAEAILLGIMDKARVDSVLITSTVRSPADQARVMYDNLEAWHNLSEGKEKKDKDPKKLYRAGGIYVIGVYDHQKAMGANAEAVKHAMVGAIIEMGPEHVSAHCTNDPMKCVFDVAPSSVPEEKKKSFANQISVTSGVMKFFMPPVDPAFHIEINLA
jgi:hypothetical protein